MNILTGWFGSLARIVTIAVILLSGNSAFAQGGGGGEMPLCSKKIVYPGPYYTGPSSCPNSCDVWAMCPSNEQCQSGNAYASCGSEFYVSYDCTFYTGGSCVNQGGQWRCIYVDGVTQPAEFEPGNEPQPITVREYWYAWNCGGVE